MYLDFTTNLSALHSMTHGFNRFINKTFLKTIQNQYIWLKDNLEADYHCVNTLIGGLVVPKGNKRWNYL